MGSFSPRRLAVLAAATVASYLFLLCPITSGTEPGEALRFSQLGVEDGVSHTTVWSAAQDQWGFLWLATETSLQRWDGYRFEEYLHDPTDPGSVSSSEIVRIFEDRDGNLWLADRRGNLDRYDRRFDRFEHHQLPLRDGDSGFVRQLTDDRRGHLWIASLGGLFSLEVATGVVTHHPPGVRGPSSTRIFALHEDPRGNLWIGGDGGLDRFDPASGDFVRLPLGADSAAVFSLTTTGDQLWIAAGSGLYAYDLAGQTLTKHHELKASVETMLSDPEGRLWITTYGRGLERYDPSTGAFEGWRHDPHDRETLSSDELFQAFYDRSGILWLSGRNGLSAYDPRRSQFRVERLRTSGRSLADRNVQTLASDPGTMVWIGGQGGHVSAWDRADDTLRAVPAPEPLGSVSAIHVAASGTVRFGTDAGLFSIHPPTQQSLRRVQLPLGSTVNAIAEGPEGTLWLGTWGEGVLAFDVEQGSLEPLALGPVDSAPPSLRIYSLLVDDSERLWVGSAAGLSRIDLQSHQATTWRHLPGNVNGPAADQIVALYQDLEGRLWIGTTGGGLDLLEADQLAADRPVFVRHRRADGLADDNVAGIAEDGQGALWISTNRGLSRLDPDSGQMRTFRLADGLSSDVFLIGAATRTGDGLMVFGGHNGLTAFRPEHLHDDPTPPTVAITALQVGGERARPGAPGSPLERSINSTDRLVLGHRQRSFALEFAALHFAAPWQNRYAFRLQGYDPEWIESDSLHRQARYTNLDPGRYRFQVKASNKDGVWTEHGAELAIEVLPPPWKTWWAYSLYGLVLIGALAAYNRWHQRKLIRERAINLQLRQVDQLKNEFLANTSHELRTPLYGITGLAESLLDGAGGRLPELARTDLEMIVQSGQRLSSLVDGILDFAKLRDHTLELRRKPIDVGETCELVVTLVQPLTAGKPLELRQRVPTDLPPALADENRLQQILINLIANAIKFTDRGWVELSAEQLGDRVRISVRDTGIGLEPNHIQRIFEPFEQADASTERDYGGTGLGLAITHQLVELHGGELEVRSTLGEGSEFYFSLPISGQAATQTTRRPTVATTSRAMPSKPALVDTDRLLTGRIGLALQDGLVQGDFEPGVATLLVVDDEPIVRRVLMNQLSQLGYRLLEAADGRQALELLEQSPDLVLLDVMMPRMSGFEVCREIRRRHKLEELPVIYLTAKNQVEDLVQGFATGGNDFLTKPIDKDELAARVRTHLHLLALNQQLDRLVEQRTAQVKTLSGLLPICASCKKIRDDHGYWNEIESYLDRHADITFTHGICNDCVERIYPGVDLETPKWPV